MAAVHENDLWRDAPHVIGKIALPEAGRRVRCQSLKTGRRQRSVWGSEAGRGGAPGSVFLMFSEEKVSEDL